MYSITFAIAVFVSGVFGVVVNLASSTVDVDGIPYYVPGNPVVHSLLVV